MMPNFKRVLIANRGEIAVRIIRACRELGIESIAVYSDVDSDSMHVRLSDESVCIGPGPARDSYLNIPAILSAAKITGADAIHPGYGFLAENERFAELVEKSGFIFVGPSASAIASMGNKIEARRLMQEAGVPVVPGALLNGEADLLNLPERLGMPLLVKAAAGGGGKGMRIVKDTNELEQAISKAR